MTNIDFQTINSQLGFAKQLLKAHRDSRQSPVQESDPIVPLHDAVNALEIAVSSLVIQLEKAQG